MSRIETVRLLIDTGASGLSGTVRMRFNGFDLELNRISGGTAPGESYVGEYLVGSVGHEVALLGPAEGSDPWDIRHLVAEFHMVEGPPQKWDTTNVKLQSGESQDLLDRASSAFEV